MATSRKNTMRIESDTLGEVRVPADALYGAQTQRAVENYPISGLREHPVFIRAFILLKKAAALANFELGEMDRKMAEAISDACDELLDDGDRPFSKLTAKGRKPSRKREDEEGADDASRDVGGINSRHSFPNLAK